MAVRDDVLRNLARVFLRLFGKEIDREALLEHSVAAVLFIRQYALDGFILPPCFFPRSRNAGFCQYLRNGVDGFAAHEQPVNEPDCFRFFRVDLRQTIWAFSVSEKLSVGHIDLAVCKPLPLAPCAVLGNGSGLLLCQRGHNREQQLALAIEGPDVFFLKIALHIVFLQGSDGGKAVNRVSGKPADALCHDQIDIPGKSVGDHPVEALPVPGVEAGDAFVGIDASEHPVGVPADIVSVVIDLCLIRGQLLVAVGRYPRVTCDPALFPLFYI